MYISNDPFWLKRLSIFINRISKRFSPRLKIDLIIMKNESKIMITLNTAVFKLSPITFGDSSKHRIIKYLSINNDYLDLLLETTFPTALTPVFIPPAT